MATRKKSAATSFNLSRLKILAAGDEASFREAVVELLASGERLAREAALEALLERPVMDLRPPLRELYFALDGNAAKDDPGAHLRTLAARVLLTIEDPRDIDVGLRAASTYEAAMGADSTGNLRATGLRIVAAADPELFPYIAVEHVDDASDFSPEPANTALQLLAGTGHQLAVYQWLQSGWRDPALLEQGLGLLDDVPPMVLARCVARISRDAIEKEDEPLLTKLAEIIVERELDDAYPVLSSIMRSGVSKELYGYLALLLAATNRAPLLAILEQQLDLDIRRRPAILEALRVRTTQEQQAILKRWAEDHG
jgi:hypothetical protein